MCVCVCVCVCMCAIHEASQVLPVLPDKESPCLLCVFLVCGGSGCVVCVCTHGVCVDEKDHQHKLQRLAQPPVQGIAQWLKEKRHQRTLPPVTTTMCATGVLALVDTRVTPQTQGAKVRAQGAKVRANINTSQ